MQVQSSFDNVCRTATKANAAVNKKKWVEKKKKNAKPFVYTYVHAYICILARNKRIACFSSYLACMTNETETV